MGGRVGMTVGGLDSPNTVGRGLGLEVGCVEGANVLMKRFPALSAAIPSTPGSVEGYVDG